MRSKEWFEKTRAIGVLLIIIGAAVFWLAYSAFASAVELWYAFLMGISMTVTVLIGVLFVLNKKFIPKWRGSTPEPERLVRIMGMASLAVAVLLILFPYLMDDRNFKNAVQVVFFIIFFAYWYYRFIRK